MNPLHDEETSFCEFGRVRTKSEDSGCFGLLARAKFGSQAWNGSAASAAFPESIKFQALIKSAGRAVPRMPPGRQSSGAP